MFKSALATTVRVLCLISLCQAESVLAAPGPRTAMVYSAWQQSAGKDVDRPAFQSLGWDYDGWQNTRLPELVTALPSYDMVVFTICYNFNDPQNFGAYGQEWKAFLERGGVLFVMDFENDPPNGLTWLAESDPRFLVRGGGKHSPYAQQSPQWIADHPLVNNLADPRLCWSYWDYVSPCYTPLIRDGAWRPQLAMQEVGDGVLVISTLYAQTGFPPSSFIDNLWKFASDPARREKYSTLTDKLEHAPAAAVNIPKLAARPTLDGDSVDAAWHNAAPLRFGAYDGSAVDDADGGLVGSFGSDLYLFIKSSLPDERKQAEGLTRDAIDSQLDDKIEVFLESIDGSRVCRRRFVVNAAGVLYDEENANPAWSGWWQATSHIDGTQWTAAIRLPLSTLAPASASAPEWRINIARCPAGSRGTSQASDWLIAPYGTADWPARLGRVTGDLALKTRIDGGPVNLPAAYWQGENTVAFLLSNPGDLPVEGELTVMPVEAGNRVSGSTRVTLPGGTTEVALPLIPDGVKPVRYQAILKSGEDVLFSTSMFSGEVLETMDAALLQPVYRGIIQSKDPTKWVEVSSTVRMDDTSPLELSAVVTLDGGSRITAQQKTMVEKSGTYTALKCEAAGWSPGTYSIRVVLAEAGSTAALRTQTFGFEILPPAATEVTFAANGSSYLNGEPFFPIGLYNVEQYQLGTAIKRGERETLVDIKNHGFNVGITCDGIPSEARMAMADELGLYLAATPYHMHQTSMRECLTQANRHASVIYWYGMDEMAGDTIDHAIDYYNFLRQIDPHRPVISAVQNWNPHIVERVRQALDIMMPDFYPIPDGKLTRVAEGADLALEFNRNNRAWIVPQSFADTMFPRAPSTEEIRCQAYLAITHGAKGLFWYCYGNRILKLPGSPSGYWFLPDYPDQWNGFTKLNHEITALSPVILEGKVIAGVSATTGIHLRALEYGGKRYVLAVNGSRAEIDARLAGATLTGTFDVLDDDRAVTAEDGGINDTFGPLEAHVYVGR